MEQLVQAKFTDFKNDDGDYPILTGLINKRNELPPPKQTRASKFVAETTRAKHEEAEAGEHKKFTMKKFQNIPGKLNLS